MQPLIRSATESVTSSRSQNHRFYSARGLILPLLTVALLLSGPAQSQTTADIPAELIHYPDYVFYNGQVLTADADQDFTIAEAVAIRGNRIFSVGASQQIQRLAGP